VGQAGRRRILISITGTTVKIPKLTYEEFLCLSDEERLSLQTIVEYTRFDVDCRHWSFGQVKDAQGMLARDLTYGDIIKVVSLETEATERMDFHIVLGLFFSIRDGIRSITEQENEALGGVPTADEQRALEAVGGFDRFGHLPELDRLAQGQIWHYNDVRSMAWGDCFVKLLYDKTINDYRKEMIR
jgi:hypothetical protein